MCSIAGLCFTEQSHCGKKLSLWISSNRGTRRAALLWLAGLWSPRSAIRPAGWWPGFAGVAHRNGTIRFGRDQKTSALDANCKAHDVDNLYVVDGSAFPSSEAANPALTILANVLRVGEHLLERIR